MANEKAKGMFKINNTDNLQYIAIPNSKYSNNPITIWNDSKLLILTPTFRGIDAAEKDKKLLDMAVKLMKQDAGKSIAGVPDFKKFDESRKDIACWICSDKIVDFIPQRKLKEFKKIFDIDLKNNFLHFNLGFNKGNIEFTTKASLNEGAMKVLEEKMAARTGVDENILKYIPKKSFVAYAGAITPEKLYNLINDAKDLSKQNEMMKKETEGLDFKQVITAFGGDFAASLHGFKTIDNNPTPQFTVSMSVKNKEIIQKLIDIATSKAGKMIEKKDNHLVVNAGKYKFYLSLTDGKTLVVTNSESVINKSEKGGFGSDSFAESELASKASKGFGFLYANLDISQYPQEFHDLLNNKNMRRRNKKQIAMATNFLGAYKSITISSIDLTTGSVKIELKDDSKNSLYAIISYIDENFTNFM